MSCPAPALVEVVRMTRTLGSKGSHSASELTFGVDGHLRRGEMVLAIVEEGGPETFGRVVVGDATYDIVRRARSGWHFAVVRPSSESTVCEFVPFRVRSGGCREHKRRPLPEGCEGLERHEHHREREVRDLSR